MRIAAAGVIKGFISRLSWGVIWFSKTQTRKGLGKLRSLAAKVDEDHVLVAVGDERRE